MFRTLALSLLLVVLPLTAQANPGTIISGPTVTLETSLGKIVVELFTDKAPLTVANFRRYIQEGFYDNLIFHRVISGFVIQTGGFETGMKPRPATSPAITNEASNGLSNKRGTLAMARTWQVDSATSQFFINLKDNANLDHQGATPPHYGYAVFGQVVEGMEVVDAIARQPTATVGDYRDVPFADVVIVKAYENQ